MIEWFVIFSRGKRIIFIKFFNKSVKDKFFGDEF